MASRRTQILIISIASAIVLLVALLFPTVILPLLPPLRPLASQLFVRLRDIFAFLAFTTAIAAGIFSTQRKDAQSNKRKKPFLEHHPLGSIFGEPGYEETEHLHTPDGDAPAFLSGTEKIDLSSGGDAADYSIDRASAVMVNGSLLEKRSSRLSTEALREGRLPVSKEENEITIERKVQKKLHRRSSSLDDGVNYEPELEAATSIIPDSSPPPATALGKNKSAKRVSFSVVPPPISFINESPDGARDTAEKQTDGSLASPGDLTRQADAFIAKFKEQIRLQKLESFQRYRRRVS